MARLWYLNRTHPPRIEIKLDASAYASCSLQAKRCWSFVRVYIESKKQKWGVPVVCPDLLGLAETVEPDLKELGMDGLLNHHFPHLTDWMAQVQQT